LHTKAHSNFKNDKRRLQWGKAPTIYHPKKYFNKVVFCLSNEKCKLNKTFGTCFYELWQKVKTKKITHNMPYKHCFIVLKGKEKLYGNCRR